MAAFNFTIIYYKKAKNPTNGLSRRSDFKDDSELSTTKRQPFPNFLSKFQEHLKDTKNDPIEEQNIDSDETPLFKNVLNLIGAPQDTNSAGVLPVKSEFKNDPVEEQSIDSDETPLFRSVLNLIKTLQDINSIRVLPARNES